jgi:hypothetical protein
MNPKVMMTRWGPPTGRKKPTHCEAEDCSQATREGKPFCSDHVERLSYVQEVQARIVAREAELAAVKKRGGRAVDLEGIIARDVLCSLWINGERSVARLSRELNVDFEVLKHYVARLKKAKQLTQTSPRRGAGKVTLVPALSEIEDPREVGRSKPEPVVVTEVPLEVAPVAAQAVTNEAFANEAYLLPALAQPLPLEELVNEGRSACGGAG